MDSKDIDRNATIDLRDCLVAKLREILRFLAQKAFECLRWLLRLFNATTVLVTCTQSKSPTTTTEFVFVPRDCPSWRLNFEWVLSFWRQPAATAAAAAMVSLREQAN